jgi:hypothetical protein
LFSHKNSYTALPNLAKSAHQLNVVHHKISQQQPSVVKATSAPANVSLLPPPIAADVAQHNDAFEMDSSDDDLCRLFVVCSV